MPNQSGRIALVLISSLLLIVVIAYFFAMNSQKQKYVESSPNSSGITNQSSNNPYYSKPLKLSLKVPADAKIDEKFVDIVISLEEGEIYVTRIATNFSSAKEYFEDLKVKNSLSPGTYEEVIMNGYDAGLVTLNFAQNEARIQKTYFLYTDNFVYTFYTADESLYPALDQIVQSFEYKP